MAEADQEDQELYRLPSYSHAAPQGIWLLAGAAAVADLAAAGAPSRRQPALPAGVAPLRARLDPDHLQPEPGRLGPGLRRPGDRDGDPRSPAAPLDDRQH